MQGDRAHVARHFLACLLGSFPAAAADLYGLQRTVEVPASPDNPIGGTFATFDIGAFDGETQTYYLSDRSNAAIDILSARTDGFMGRIGGRGHVFRGQGATNGVSGPNGLLVIDRDGQHQVLAGNADSTIIGFDLPAAPGSDPNVKINTDTPELNRVDEISYDPEHKLVLAGNNATAINFASLVDIDRASPGFGTVRRKLTFDGTNGLPVGSGVEAGEYNRVTHSFFLAVQHLGPDTSSPGGLIEVDPAVGKVTRVMDFATERFGALSRCAPSGVSVAASGRIVVGCAVASQSLVIDPAGEGRVVALIPDLSGVDQIAYDPVRDRWFLAARDNPGGPVLGIVDATTGRTLQMLPTSFNAHSVAVDPVSGKVFVPLGGHASNTVCPKGCIAIFAPR